MGVIAVLGTSRDYDPISRNFAITLDQQIEANLQDYMAGSILVHVTDGLRVHVDIAVYQNAAPCKDNALLSPLLIAEVIGTSTRDFDEETRLKQYQAIASLQNLLFVAENRMEVVYYRRQADGKWALFNTYTSRRDALPIPVEGIIFYVPMSKVYQGDSFADAD